MFRPNFEKGGGLIVAIAQDWLKKDVLMQAWMNEEAWGETLRTGLMVYYSRSRKKLWRKGEESGHRQLVHRVFVDCDADSAVFLVSQAGGACHDGYRTCYYRILDHMTGGLGTREQRLFDPSAVYTKSETSQEPPPKREERTVSLVDIRDPKIRRPSSGSENFRGGIH